MLRIRTLSLGAAVFLIGAVPALAADPYGNPYDSSAMLAAPAGFTWTGPYLGAIVGYGWNGFTGTSGPLDGRSLNAQGGKIGLYGGYNAEVGNGLVLGGEADLSIDGVNGSKVVWGSASQKWDATARARAGYSFGRVMAYGTGGAAITGATVDNGVFDSSANHLGWVVGGGVEGALTDHVTARLEYQYESFGSQLYRTGLGTSSDVELNSSTVRAGIGYKF